MPGHAINVMPGLLRSAAKHRGLIGFFSQALLRALGRILRDFGQRLLHGGALLELGFEFSQCLLWIVLRILCHVSQLLGLVVGFIQGLLHAEVFFHLLELCKRLLRHLLTLLHLGEVLRQLLQSIGRLLLRLRGLLQSLRLRLRLLRLRRLLEILFNLRGLLTHRLQGHVGRASELAFAS